MLRAKSEEQALAQIDQFLQTQDLAAAERWLTVNGNFYGTDTDVMIGGEIEKFAENFSTSFGAKLIQLVTDDPNKQEELISWFITGGNTKFADDLVSFGWQPSQNFVNYLLEGIGAQGPHAKQAEDWLIKYGLLQPGYFKNL